MDKKELFIPSILVAPSGVAQTCLVRFATYIRKTEE